jgi:hypothetical protein
VEGDPVTTFRPFRVETGIDEEAVHGIGEIPQGEPSGRWFEGFRYASIDSTAAVASGDKGM